jgi:hypothetical protein
MVDLGYILEQDILDQLDADTLTELTGGRKAIGDSPAVPGDSKIWKDYEPKAVEKVKGYSRHWYDMNTEMRSIIEYDVTEANTEGQRVAAAAVDGERKLYLCIQDAPAGTVLTNTAFFTETDDRNPIMLEAAVIFVIYNLSRRKNPRQIPEQRQIDYDNTIDTMKDVQRGKIMLEIAERVDVTEDDPGQEFPHGDFENSFNDTY